MADHSRPEAAQRQALSDLEKLQVEHRLEIRRLLIDRLLIGALIGLAGFGATLVIERVKATAVETHYFLEKRFEAATQVRTIFSEISSELFAQTVPACQLTPVQRPPVEKLKAAISAEIGQLNSSSLLFTKPYLDDATKILAICSGAAAAPDKITCDARSFFAEIGDFLTRRTKEEALGDQGLKWAGFVPLGVSQIDLDKMGAVEYFEKNLSAWQSARAAANK